MQIWNIAPNNVENFQAKAVSKAETSNVNSSGISFAESIREVARSANMSVTSGSMAAGLNFKTQKEENLSRPFSFLEAEEEIIENSLAKIHKLLQELSE
jgi:hypothetical protein